MPPIRFDQVNAPNLNAVSQILARATGDIGGAFKGASNTIGQLAERKKERDSLPALLELSKVQNEDQFQSVAGNLTNVDPSEALIAAVLGGGERARGLENDRAVEDYNTSAAARNRALGAVEADNLRFDRAEGILTNELAEGFLNGDFNETQALTRLQQEAANGTILPGRINAILGAASGTRDTRQSVNDFVLGRDYIGESKLTEGDAVQKGFISGDAVVAQFKRDNPTATDQAVRDVRADFENSDLGKKLASTPLDPVGITKTRENAGRTASNILNIRNEKPVFNAANAVRDRTAGYKRIIEGDPKYNRNSFVDSLVKGTEGEEPSKKAVQRVRAGVNTIFDIFNKAGVTDEATIYAAAESYLTGNVKDFDSLYQYLKDGANTGAFFGTATGAALGAFTGPGILASTGTGFVVGTGAGTALGLGEYILDHLLHDNRDTNNDLSGDEKFLLAGLASTLAGGNPEYQEILGKLEIAEREGEVENQRIREEQLVRSYVDPNAGVPPPPPPPTGTGIKTSDTAIGGFIDNALSSDNFIGQAAERVGDISFEHLSQVLSEAAIGAVQPSDNTDVGFGRGSSRTGDEGIPARTIPPIPSSVFGSLTNNVEDLRGVDGAVINGLVNSINTEAGRLNGRDLTPEQVNNSISKVVRQIADRENLSAAETKDIIEQLQSVITLKVLGQ